MKGDSDYSNAYKASLDIALYSVIAHSYNIVSPMHTPRLNAIHEISAMSKLRVTASSYSTRFRKSDYGTFVRNSIKI